MPDNSADIKIPARLLLKLRLRHHYQLKNLKLLLNSGIQND